MSGRETAADDHERVVLASDPATGLRAVVAVHSTALGPAVGGLRICRYPDRDAAVRDALRLSYAMTLKNAAAGLRLGGGKAVILDDGRPGRREQRLLAFADVLNELGGRYVTAEDVGTTPSDMDVLAARTPHVLGRSPAHGGSGDPSPATALTVHAAIREAVRVRLGRTDLEGLAVGVVGAGKVGGRLAADLARDGARVVVSDVAGDRAQSVARSVGGRAVGTDELLALELAVLAPCATGELIDAELAGRLRCAIVAGAANNPLVDRAAAVALAARDILYVPDFLANCGGMLSIAAEYRGDGSAGLVDAAVGAAARLRSVLEEAQASGRLPLDVARERALAVVAAAAAAPSAL